METTLILDDSVQGTWLRTQFKTKNEFEISQISGLWFLKNKGLWFLKNPA